MTPVIHLLVACTLLVSVSGCVNSQWTPIGERTYPPRPSDQVIDVYLAWDASVRAFKTVESPKHLDTLPSNALEIGRIESHSHVSWAATLKDAKKNAKKVGGDGIVVKRMSESWPSVPPCRFMSSTVVRYHPE